MNLSDATVHAKIVEHFARAEPNSDEQTLIALFIQSTKTANAGALSKIIMAPLDWIPFRFMHEQYFKELELISLITRATQWSVNPLVYAEAAQLNVKFMQQTGFMEHLSGTTPAGSPMTAERAFYEYLALSHAFMAQIRLLPLFPIDHPLTSPFMNALGEIESNNGRMIQTQIRLLKDLKTSLTIEEREEIIERYTKIVRDLFTELLRAICMPNPNPSVDLAAMFTPKKA